MAHPRLRALVASVLLGGMTVLARAQPANTTAPHVAGKRVLFLLPAAAEATQAELREALLAQFALIDADLAFEPAGDPKASLAEHMSDAERRAAAQDAVAVFWIDMQSGDRWLVHMMDSARAHVVVRPVDAAGDRRSAAIEAVAVMTRESTRALLEGVPPPDSPPPEAAGPESGAQSESSLGSQQQADAEPHAEAQPESDADTASGRATEATPAGSSAPAPLVRLAAGYSGADVGAVPFRHGVALGADFLGFAPFYIGLGYVFTPSVQVAETARFKLQALPFLAHAGHRSRFGPLAADLELGLVVEVLRSSAAEDDPSTGVKPWQRGTRTLVALAPRLRGEWLPVPDLGVYAALGLEVLLNNFSYVVEYVDAPGMPQRTVLRGHELRPVVELGIAFYP